MQNTQTTSSSRFSLFNSENNAYFQTGQDAIQILKDLNGTCIGLNQYTPEISYIEQAINVHNKNNDTSNLYIVSCVALTSAVLTLAKKIGEKTGKSIPVVLDSAHQSVMNGMYYKASKEDYAVLANKFNELKGILLGNDNKNCYSLGNS